MLTQTLKNTIRNISVLLVLFIAASHMRQRAKRRFLVWPGDCYKQCERTGTR